MPKVDGEQRTIRDAVSIPGTATGSGEKKKPPAFRPGAFAFDDLSVRMTCQRYAPRLAVGGLP
ncbi:MAG: hypothetical protein D6725_10300 [Planctomycetota bacterium]|nr:MAG: hypothetical protein D6725_10300 [Planctomycetota bacterium]